MAGNRLAYIDKFLELEEIGQNIMLNRKFDVMQLTRALYYHGKKNGKKFSYTKTKNGYLVTLVSFR